MMRFSTNGWAAGRCLAPLFALAALLPVGANAAPVDPGGDYVRADLLAATDAAAPGATLSLAVRLRHAPHWHTYWIVPGDAGLPTQLAWKLPAGYTPGPIAWPVPQLLRVGTLANYGFEGEVLLPVTVRVPDGAAPGTTAPLAVHAQWLVCSDLCIPGGADLSLSLPVRSAGQVHDSADAAAIESARRRLPAPLALAGAHAYRQGARVHLEFQAPTGAPPRALEYFPLEAGRIVPAAEQRLSVAGRKVALELVAEMPGEPGFAALRGVLVGDGGPGSQSGWAGVIDLPLAAAPAAGAASAGSAASMTPPSSPGTAALPPTLAPAAAPSGDGAVVAAPAAPAAAPPTLGSTSVLVALLGAFLGGLILNLMPCVFPVLSLKLMALVRHRHESPARLRAHALAYAAGVELSFLLLAALLIGLRAAGSQIGWGFQLQSPLVIAVLIGLFFLIGLNLLGTFEFAYGAGLANTRMAQSVGGEGLRGSFATGVLAAVVASPCTAPFMGAALGYAMTQPIAVALLVFAALGAGMAAPYLLLTLVPAWLDRLPRPGVWMERLKQFMAFPMFLTGVWLFWVLGQQIDMDAVAGMLAALVALSLFAWSLGLSQRGAVGFGWLALVAAGLSLLLLLPLVRAGGTAAPAPAIAGAEWAPWSPAVQRAAIERNNPVFVDFTAAWCITCQANKRLVLHDAGVAAAFRAHGVVRLQADWTRRDEAIARELARFARSGVPMYVLYDSRGQAHLLPEILSRQGLLEELARL